MDYFLDYLAERRYYYYNLLNSTSVTTGRECFSRIQDIAKYEQLMDTISNLPIEYETSVEARFKQLKEDFR